MIRLLFLIIFPIYACIGRAKIAFSLLFCQYRLKMALLLQSTFSISSTNSDNIDVYPRLRWFSRHFRYRDTRNYLPQVSLHGLKWSNKTPKLHCKHCIVSEGGGRSSRSGLLTKICISYCHTPQVVTCITDHYANFSLLCVPMLHIELSHHKKRTFSEKRYRILLTNETKWDWLTRKIFSEATHSIKTHGQNFFLRFKFP